MTVVPNVRLDSASRDDFRQARGRTPMATYDPAITGVYHSQPLVTSINDE
jgi:hypothetical protein